MGRFAGTLSEKDYTGICSICGEPKSMIVNLFGMFKLCANHTESNCPNKKAVEEGKWGEKELNKRKEEIKKLKEPIRFPSI